MYNDFTQLPQPMPHGEMLHMLFGASGGEVGTRGGPEMVVRSAYTSNAIPSRLVPHATALAAMHGEHGAETAAHQDSSYQEHGAYLGSLHRIYHEGRAARRRVKTRHRFRREPHSEGSRPAMRGGHGRDITLENDS